MNRREREYAESHSDHLLISSSGTADTVIVPTHTHAHTHTKLKYKNLPVRSQKAFPSPSHIRCWAHRLDLKLLGAIQYGPGLEPSFGRFSEVLFTYLLSYLFQGASERQPAARVHQPCPFPWALFSFLILFFFSIVCC